MVRFRVAPLPGSFMIISIVGFFISVFFIPRFSVSWAFALSFFFVLLIIASFISMTEAPLDPDEAKIISVPPKKRLKVDKKKVNRLRKRLKKK